MPKLRRYYFYLSYSLKLTYYTSAYLCSCVQVYNLLTCLTNYIMHIVFFFNKKNFISNQKITHSFLLIFVVLGFDSLQVAPQFPGKVLSFASTRRVPQLCWVISHLCFLLQLPWLAICHSFTLTKENRFQIPFCFKAPTSQSSLTLLCKYNSIYRFRFTV